MSNDIAHACCCLQDKDTANRTRVKSKRKEKSTQDFLHKNRILGGKTTTVSKTGSEMNKGSLVHRKKSPEPSIGNKRRKVSSK